MNEQMIAERDSLRETLMLAALPHVPFEGWGLQALMAGARDAGIASQKVHEFFPAGAKDMIHCYCLGIGQRKSPPDSRGKLVPRQIQ